MATKDITDRKVVEACVKLLSGEQREVGKCTGIIDLLQSMTGQSEKVCLRAAERAQERGLIESGVSIHWAWATEKGKELLT